ncbi:MAG: hypothetical protein MJE68_23830, partial [Proteobacteria bacterium]|nr:hypothetical protein [Pseudomonadota bacterium]
SLRSSLILRNIVHISQPLSPTANICISFVSAFSKEISTEMKVLKEEKRDRIDNFLFSCNCPTLRCLHPHISLFQGNFPSVIR